MHPRCLREHRARACAEAHRAGQVDVEHFGEHRRIVLGAAADDAGAIDEDVEPRQIADRAPRSPPRRARRALRASRQRNAGRAACRVGFVARRAGHGDDGTAAPQARRQSPHRCRSCRPTTSATRPANRSSRNVAAIMRRARAAHAPPHRAAAAPRRRSRSSPAPRRRSRSAPPRTGSSPAIVRAAKAPSKQSPAPVASTVATHDRRCAPRGGRPKRCTPSRAALEHDDRRARAVAPIDDRVRVGLPEQRSHVVEARQKPVAHARPSRGSSRPARGNDHSFSRRFGSYETRAPAARAASMAANTASHALALIAWLMPETCSTAGAADHVERAASPGSIRDAAEPARR